MTQNERTNTINESLSNKKTEEKQIDFNGGFKKIIYQMFHKDYKMLKSVYYNGKMYVYSYPSNKYYSWGHLKDPEFHPIFKRIIQKITEKAQNGSKDKYPQHSNLIQSYKTIEDSYTDVIEPDLRPIINTPSGKINLSNKELKVEEYQVGEFALSIKYDYNKDAVAPKWFEDMIAYAFPKKDAQIAYWEMLGQSMILNRDLHTSYWYPGKAGSGKSTLVGEVLRAIHNKSNVSAVEPKEWGKPEKRYGMINRSVNISGDGNIGARFDEGSFKSMATGEILEGRVLFGMAQNFTPTALLVSTMNHLPTIFDQSDGVYRRMVINPMNNVIKNPDYRVVWDIRDNKDGVLEYIVKMAIESAFKLFGDDKKDAMFPKDGEILKGQIKSENVPIIEYLLQRDDDYATSEVTLRLGQLLKSYNIWAIENNRNKYNMGTLKRALEFAYDTDKEFNKNVHWNYVQGTNNHNPTRLVLKGEYIIKENEEEEE